jgi:CBS domain containing-hemolysin-like protein
MTDDPVSILLATVAIIGLSALFVAAEFAVIAAKRHRVEHAAVNSVAARAALRNFGELQLVLAGSQLGITVCTLALGAITKPAVHHWLMPPLESLGLPSAIADGIAFLLALFIVTFLHLVIGEMAPKSWAIAHPERSATLLAIPMRGFLALTRPLLRGLNRAANALVRRAGAEPTDTLSSSQNPDELQQLVAHSINVGALDVQYAAPIEAALQLRVTTLRDLVDPDRTPVAVPPAATVAQVRAASRQSGHRRILVGTGATFSAVVHVRDTMASDPQDPTAPFERPVFRLPATMTLHRALAEMRRTRQHLAVVMDGETTVGLVTLADVLVRLAPEALEQVREAGPRSGRQDAG